MSLQNDQMEKINEYNELIESNKKKAVIYTVNDSKISQFCESQISVSTDKKYFAVGSIKDNIYVINLLDGSLQKTINNKALILF